PALSRRDGRQASLEVDAMTARMTISRRLRAALTAAAAALLLVGCAHGRQDQGTYASAGDPGQGSIVLGADSSAESRVVAALYEQLLTAAGKKVQAATASYATAEDSAKAVGAGRLTLTPAYETALLRAFPGGQNLPGNMTATLSMALPMGIDALPPAAAQRGVVLTVSRATARRYGLHCLADLAKTHGRLTLGGSAAGDLDAPSVKSLAKTNRVALTAAGTSDSADVRVLRSTDPVIARKGLVVLIDPKGVIPPEHVFPLINSDYADKATRTSLARLNTVLTTDQLASLVSAVSGGENPAQAATAWLHAKGFLH
ncbi:glycine betaine ABC transporter substrate-binding protein, partial [Streptomyces mirabilis]|uniref:glycine betaine ABC transporter substrate-binding protein n=1 Tax=Streptomyces mirabilis TaxID=68239 RepID=UPI0036571E50